MKVCKKCNRSDVEFHTIVNRCGKQAGESITRLVCKGCESKRRVEANRKNKDRANAANRKSYHKHRDEISKRRKEVTKNDISDDYIIRKIFKTKNDVPKELVEVKKLVLQIKRLIKNDNIK